MAEINQQQNNELSGRAPSTLEVYKESPVYKIKTRLANMSPKKKLVAIVLPILVVAAGLILYFTLAANPAPELLLRWSATNTAINGTDVSCGKKDQSIDVIVNNLVVNNSTGARNDIVSVGTFLTFDAAKIEVTGITVGRSAFPIGDGDVTPASQGTLQKIDNVAGTLQIVRGITANPTTGGFTVAEGILATIHFNVKEDVVGPAIFRFSQTDPTQTIFVFNGGDSAAPSNVSDEPTINIKCCASPNDLCLSHEYCPGNDWFGGIAAAADRCCQKQCLEGIELYLFEPALEVNVGTEFAVNINMRPDYLNVSQITGQLTVDSTSILSNLRVAVAPGVTGTASLSGNTITLNINHRPTNSPAVVLATIRMTGTTVGEVRISFTNASATLADGTVVDQSQLAKNGGLYKITPPKVRLCQGSSLIVSPGYDSVDFGLCTEPDSICRAEVSGTTAADTANVKNHNLNISSLTPGSSYSYMIRCTRSNYEDLPLSGNFVLSARQELSIDNLTKKEQATKASLQWDTSGGRNGDSNSDSYVCYRQVGASGNFTLQKMDVSVIRHGITLTGLTPSTASNTVTYEYYVSSARRGTRTSGQNCGSAPGSLCQGSSPLDCAVSARQTLTTKIAAAEADANVILKVTRDRVCDEWLYCDAATQILDTTKNPPESKDICFKTGLCDKMDEGGRCVSVVEGKKSPLTVSSPAEVTTLKNMSGYAKAGLDWGKRCLNSGKKCSSNSDCGSSGTTLATCVDAKIDGFYPYDQMVETGIPVGIANAGFEDWSEKPWEKLKTGVIENYADPNNGINRVLRIKPEASYDGAIAKKVASRASQSSAKSARYIVSFRAKTDDPTSQEIMVELAYNNDQYKAFKYFDPASNQTSDKIKLTNSWQYYVASLPVSELPVINGALGLAIVQAPTTSKIERSFYIDNIAMKSVLEAGDNLNYIPRSCRIYPTQNAPACDYYDSQTSKDYKGWKGYCVETDPKYQERKFVNQPMCLLWWPVDIISGESNMFSKESTAGYTGRKPLYYCLEATGNYKRCGARGDSLSQICGDKYEVHNYYTTASAKSMDSCDEDQSGTPHTFYVCRNEYSSSDSRILIDSKMVEYGLKEYEVDSIVLEGQILAWDYPSPLVLNRSKFGTSEDINGVNYKYTREEVAGTGEVLWKIDSGYKNGTNRIKFAARFNKERGLIEYIYNGADDTGDKHEGEAYVVKIYLREPCTKIAKVVDEYGQSVPWAQRVNSVEIRDNLPSWLGYKKDQDYAPYGSAVVPMPSGDPNGWGMNPLYVEPADKSSGFTAPYQVRAGSPYGMVRMSMASTPSGTGSGATTRTCECLVNGRTGDCHEISGQWYCVPNYDSSAYDCLSDTQWCIPNFGSGLECRDQNSGAPPAAGERGWCMVENNNCGVTCGSSGAGSSGGASAVNLAGSPNLFGPATCISGSRTGAECPNGNYDCGLDWETGEYGKCVGFNKPESKTWDQINSLIKQYSGQTRVQQLFARDYGIWNWEYRNDKWQYIKADETVEGWDITEPSQAREAYYPKIDYINTDKSEVYKQGSVILKFTSWVDPNHEPLVRYSVDWGDGTESTESGLRIAGRGPANPHILVHYYKFSDCPSGSRGQCTFRPKVQIEDNWGLCNGAGDCDNVNSWKNLGYAITVYEEDGFGVLNVSPTTLDFYHNANGLVLSSNSTLYFTVRNNTPSQGRINWTLDRTSLDTLVGASNITLTPSSGVLDPTQQTRVALTISGPGALGAGTHTARIVVRDSNTGQEKEVTINITIGNKVALPGSLIDAFTPNLSTLGTPASWQNAIDNDSLTIAALPVGNGEAVFRLDTNGLGCTTITGAQIYVGVTGDTAVTGFCAAVGGGKNGMGAYTSLGCDNTVVSGWLRVDAPGTGLCDYYLKITSLTNGGGSTVRFSELTASND